MKTFYNIKSRKWKKKLLSQISWDCLFKICLMFVFVPEQQRKCDEPPDHILWSILFCDQECETYTCWVKLRPQETWILLVNLEFCTRVCQDLTGKGRGNNRLNRARRRFFPKPEFLITWSCLKNPRISPQTLTKYNIQSVHSMHA